MHAEKGKPGQFIGKVDPNSPAEAAGMHEGDRIIEVNGDSVFDESHSQVVTRIKSTPGTVRMLVIEPDGERYYREKGITIRSDMPNVVVGEARDKTEPPPEPTPVVAAAVHVESKQGKVCSWTLIFHVVQAWVSCFVKPCVVNLSMCYLVEAYLSTAWDVSIVHF